MTGVTRLEANTALDTPPPLVMEKSAPVQPRRPKTATTPASRRTPPAPRPDAPQATHIEVRPKRKGSSGKLKDRRTKKGTEPDSLKPIAREDFITEFFSRMRNKAAEALSYERQMELLKEAQRGNLDARNTLVLANLGAVECAIAKFFHLRLPPEIFEDAAQSAIIRICQVITRFKLGKDPAKGNQHARLQTWLTSIAIRQIQREITRQRNHFTIPIDTGRFYREVQEVVGIIAILKEQLGYIPDVDTIARERMRRRNKTGGGTAAQPDESVEKTRFAVHRESVRAALRVTSFVFSVEELAHASEDDDHRIIDDIADPEDCFARTIEQLCIRQDPRWQKLTALGPLTKAILQLFACDFSFRQIGILLARRFDNQRQVSGERVRQIANKDLIAHGLPPLKLLEHPPRRKVK